MTPAEPSAAGPAGPDPDFARRWSVWLAQGVAHERLVRQRAFGAIVVGGVMAIAAAIVYARLAP